MNDNRFIQFFSAHWSKLLMAVLILTALLIVLERKNHSSHLKNKKDFITSKVSLDQFYAGYPLDMDSLALLQGVLKKHPELHPRYDFVLTESLLTLDKVHQATPLAKKNLQRVKGLTPSGYHEFAHTSLLMDENKLGQALIASMRLAETLEANDDDKYATLKGFNLLRIIFLAKASGNQERLETTTHQLRTLPIYKKIAPLFEEGDITLDQFFTSDNI